MAVRSDFTGALVAPALNLLQHKVVKLIGQIDVTGWHGAALLCNLASVPRFCAFSSVYYFVECWRISPVFAWKSTPKYACASQ
jgi:hypothetical protein